MAPGTTTRTRNGTDRNSTSPNPSTSTATRVNTRRNGTSIIIEDLQDVKSSEDGRKYLEKHLLLCPPGEPATHTSLATCLHQISAMSGLQKPVTNAIRSVAFLLDELEESHINETVKEALDNQINEFATDVKMLFEDAKVKIDEHIKSAEERLSVFANTAPSQPRPTPTTYASALINPPSHANPRVAAREGIRARQFAVEGVKSSKFSHLDNLQLKTELNKILADLGLAMGKIRSITSARNGSTILEMDSDEAATWLSKAENQTQLCNKIDPNTVFRSRTYSVMAFNVPIALDPNDDSHRQEICEANNFDPFLISAAKWAKSVDKRVPNQRTAHLLLTFVNADAANRAIVNGLSICNRRCHVEKTKKEPVRCLKCQGWNHFAKECTATQDKCGNCAENHRTSDCHSATRSCVSCGSDDHASWNRACPTFLKKMDEFNIRNPDNSLQFFPTADSWTWTPTIKTYTPRPPSSKKTTPQIGLSNVQLGKRPQQPVPSQQSQHPQASQRSQRPRRQYDTYIPNYSNLIDLDDGSAPTNWWDNPTSAPANSDHTPASQQASGSGQGIVANPPIRPPHISSSNA